MTNGGKTSNPSITSTTIISIIISRQEVKARHGQGPADKTREVQGRARCRSVSNVDCGTA